MQGFLYPWGDPAEQGKSYERYFSQKTMGRHDERNEENHEKCGKTG